MSALELPEAEIFDLDGTLVDVLPVRHLVQKGPGRRRDLHGFHEYATGEGLPILATVEKARRAHAEGRAIILVSGRHKKWETRTCHWLTWHQIPWDLLFMRADSDMRKDHIVKREIYVNRIQPYFKVVRCHDDRPSIVALWRELGLEVDVVPGWDEED